MSLTTKEINAIFREKFLNNPILQNLASEVANKLLDTILVSTENLDSEDIESLGMLIENAFVTELSLKLSTKVLDKATEYYISQKEYEVCSCEKVDWGKVHKVETNNLVYEICGICDGSVSVEGKLLSSL